MKRQDSYACTSLKMKELCRKEQAKQDKRIVRGTASFEL